MPAAIAGINLWIYELSCSKPARCPFQQPQRSSLMLITTDETLFDRAWPGRNHAERSRTISPTSILRITMGHDGAFSSCRGLNYV